MSCSVENGSISLLLKTVSQFTTSPLMHRPDICTINISDCTYKNLVDVYWHFSHQRCCKSDSYCVLNHFFSPLSDEESFLLFQLRSSYVWGLMTGSDHNSKLWVSSQSKNLSVSVYKMHLINIILYMLRIYI